MALPPDLTQADLVWTFTNVKVAPILDNRTNVVVAIDYRIDLASGPHKVWRFGNVVLATTAVESFVMLENATVADIAAMAVQMHGQEAFSALFSGMQAELAEVVANGALSPALVADLPFPVTVATPADIAVSAVITPTWNEDVVYSTGQVVLYEGQLWKKFTTTQSGPPAGWDLVVDAGSEP